MDNEDFRTIFKDNLIEIKKIRSRLLIQRKNSIRKTKQTNLVNFVVKDIYLVCWSCGYKNFNKNILEGRNDCNQKVRLCNNCNEQIDLLD